MATPTGRPASEARGFFARVRRRKKQDQSDFDPLFAALFDFGAVAAGGLSANTLTLPADVEIAFQNTFVTASLDLGVFDATLGVSFFNVEGAAIGGRCNIRKLFRAPHEIQITRAPVAPAGTVVVSFRGPKSALVPFGIATFT